MSASTARLFTPFKIGKIVLPNRFLVPSMQRGVSVGGAPTLGMRDYLADRIRGGFGLVMSESCAVDHPLATSQPAATQLTAKTASAWAQVIAGVHAAGGRMFMQLWHEGASRRAETGAPPSISPSGLLRNGVANGVAAEADDLAQIREAYVRSALLAKEIGADGIEIHSCHGYLLDQFLWSDTNLRTDEYGGPNLSDRLRFPVEIVRAVRAAVGDEMPISIRFSQWKEADFEGVVFKTPDDIKVTVETMEKAGVDMFHVSQRRFYQPAWPSDPRSLAGWFKSYSRLPVVTAGGVGLNTELRDMIFGQGGTTRVTAGKSIIELANGLERGEFDLVSVGRASIGDGNWVRKVREQKFDSIRAFDLSDLASSTEWDTFAFDAAGS